MTIPQSAGTLRGFDLFDYQRALEASDLPTGQRHLLLVMAFTPAKGSEGMCSGPRFSHPQLAASTGYRLRGVIKALQAVEKAGWLVKIPGGRGRRNSYRLMIPTAHMVIHNPCTQCRGQGCDQCTECTTTRALSAGDPCTQCTPVYPLLTPVPSIVERVRARVRAACPDLQPDDDDLARLIKTLETRQPRPVRNVAGYLQQCPPADIRRLLAELAEPAPAPKPSQDQGDVPDCEHGNPGGMTSAGTPRCPLCRRSAAHLLRSEPFRPPVDGGHPGDTLAALEAVSAPIPAAVNA